MERDGWSREKGGLLCVLRVLLSELCGQELCKEILTAEIAEDSGARREITDRDRPIELRLLWR